MKTEDINKKLNVENIHGQEVIVDTTIGEHNATISYTNPSDKDVRVDLSSTTIDTKGDIDNCVCGYSKQACHCVNTPLTMKGEEQDVWKPIIDDGYVPSEHWQDVKKIEFNEFTIPTILSSLADLENGNPSQQMIALIVRGWADFFYKGMPLQDALYNKEPITDEQAKALI